MTIGGVPALVYVTNGTGQIHKITYSAWLVGIRLRGAVAGATRRHADGTDHRRRAVPGRRDSSRQVRRWQLTVADRGGVPLGAGAASLNVTAKDSAGSRVRHRLPVWSAAADDVEPQLHAPARRCRTRSSARSAPMARCASSSASRPTSWSMSAATSRWRRASPRSLRPASSTLGPGQATDDGLQQGEGLRGAGSITTLPIAGRVGIPLNVPAVVLNITVTEATAAGYVTVYPCGGDPPLASNINVAPGATVANQVVTKIGTGGSVCIFTQSPLQLIADVDAYFSGPTTYAPLVPHACSRLAMVRARSTVCRTVAGFARRERSRRCR